MGTVLETIRQCDLCGSNDLFLFDATGHIMHCRVCGFRFTSPRKRVSVEQADTDTSYAEVFGKRFDLEVFRILFRRRLDLFRRYQAGGNVLDVGAGHGVFLKFLQELGGYAGLHGTEISAWCVGFVKERFGITIDQGTLEEAAYPSGSFDALTMWHVLEHVPSPTQTVKEVARVLKPGGLLFVAVPNDSRMVRTDFTRNKIKGWINRSLGHKVLKMKKMYPVYAQEGNWHLSHFTPATLRRVLAANGFSILKETLDDGYNRSGPAVAKAERKFRRAQLLERLTGLKLFDAILFIARKG